MHTLNNSNKHTLAIQSSHFRNAVRWTVAVLCIVYIILFLWRNRESLDITLSLSPAIVLFVVVLMFSYYLLHSYRYLLVVVKCGGFPIRYWAWFRIFVLGLFLNKFVPQSGNVYRSVLLKRNHNVPYTRYVSAYFSFAWMDTCLNLLIAAVLVVIADPHMQIAGINGPLLLLGLALASALSPLIALKLCYLIELRWKRSMWIQSKLSEVFAVTMDNLKDMRYLISISLYGLITFALMCVMFYSLFGCFKLELSLPAMALFYALYKISSYLNITPGNLGIRELAYGVLSDQMHIGMAEGVLVSVVFRILAYLVLFSLALPMGGLAILRRAERPDIPPKIAN